MTGFLGPELEKDQSIDERPQQPGADRERCDDRAGQIRRPCIRWPWIWVIPNCGVRRGHRRWVAPQDRNASTGMISST